MIGKKEFKRYTYRNKSLLQRLKLTNWDKFSSYEQAYWFLWLAGALETGLSLKNAIDLSQDMWPKNPQLIAIQKSLASGNSFAVAIKPMVNSSLQMQLALAEEHGCLEEALNRIGDLMCMKQKQLKKLHGLLQYPCLLMVMLLAVIVMMKLYVFPEISQWMDSDNQLVQLVDQATMVGWTLGGGLITLLVAFGIRYWRATIIQRTQLLCRMPIIGSCVCQYYRYYLTVNLTMLLENGLSIRQICQLLTNQPGKNLLTALAHELESHLVKGESINHQLTKYVFIPPELVRILETGRAKSMEVQDLLALTKVLFHRLTTIIEKRLAMVQPLLFGTLALIIVGLYLMLLLPIYSSMQGAM